MKKALACVALVITFVGATVGMAFAGDPSYQDAVVTTLGGGMTNDQLDWSFPADAYSATMNVRYTPGSAQNYLAPPATSMWVGEPFSLRMYNFDNGTLVSADKPTT